MCVISNSNDNFTQRWTENPDNQYGSVINFLMKSTLHRIKTIDKCCDE